ncbi:hypothetical protein ACFFRR_003893 [Megaselia abdita]
MKAKESMPLTETIKTCCQGVASSSANTSDADSTHSEHSGSLTHYQNIYDSFDVSFPKRPEVNIEFEKIKYTVRKFNITEKKFVTKEILHGINGSFRSGELTAIMGPSGSGKSTLLNVMTGFTATGVTGVVRVNEKVTSTNTESYRRLSCYIHQDDLVRPMLSVGETMMITAHLKLGYKVTQEYKLSIVKKVLVLLGLDHRYNTYTIKLSGGQKKRLAIALELICNPPVLYLDEPTSGLDSSSCSQCVSLLKMLAKQGHTIVCTIHQPSALIFEMFDKLYTVVDGNCMYQGPTRELIPFLADQGLLCPSYHNPADFLLEVAVGEYERDLNKLINAANKKYYEDSDLYHLNNIRNGIQHVNEKESEKKTGFLYKFCGNNKLSLNFNTKVDEEMECESAQPEKGKADLDMEKLIEPASFIMQYFLLLNRLLIGVRRSYFLLIARIVAHVVIGTIFGYIYMNVGVKATTVLGNYVYFYGTVLLLVYMGKMAVVMTFPLEIDMLKREHFNRWYKLLPYFLSVISYEIPFQTFCACLYMAISYYLTGNFVADMYRFYYFLILGSLATLAAQAWGFFVGATMPMKVKLFCFI